MEKNLIRNILAMGSTYRKRFIAGIIMVLLCNCLLISNPLILRVAVMAMDPSSGHPNDHLSLFLMQLFGQQFYSLRTWVLFLLVITTLSAYFKYQMRCVFIMMSREVEQTVRSKLFRRIQEQSRAFFDRHGVGELMSRLTNDITAYREVLGPGIMYPLYFITLVTPGTIALFFISSRLALLSLIPLAVLPFLIYAVQGYIYRGSLQVQESLSELSSMAHEDYSGIRIVKSYVVEERMLDRFRNGCIRLVGLNLRLNCLLGMFYPLLNLIIRFVTVLIVLVAAMIILQAWSELSTADFLSFMWIQAYVTGPVMMLAWILPVYQKGGAAYHRLYEIYQVPIDVYDNSQSTLVVPRSSPIVFHNLSFTYPTAQTATLTDLNLEIQPGSFVGITGPVGSGKTTLFRLLSREYEIPRGMIKIGPQDIHDYSFQALWKEMVIVEQTPFLFSKSIAENVIFGREEVTRQELEMVSEQADLHETIMTFPEHYETVVGERGVTLSGGQKQRVSLARALLGNHSILLFDDIFSAVDTETEKHIFQEIKEKFFDKTILLITHRVSLLEQVDRVIYMADGKIVEDGSPEALKTEKSHFAALVELQKLRV